MYGGINSCAPMSYVSTLDMKSGATLQNYSLKANRWPGDNAEGFARISSGTFNFLEVIPHILQKNKSVLFEQHQTPQITEI